MIRKLLLAAAVGAAAVPAAAALNVPVPTNAYISFGGLDWAWASPCSPTGCAGGEDPLDLSYQGTQGWRLPTLAELLAGPTAADFVFAGANIPNGGADINGTTFTGSPGGDAACAAAYFTPGFFNHCDYNDAAIGAVFGLPGFPGEPNVETWVVRGEIPEPGTWAMMIMGFGLVGTALRRRTLATA